MNAPYSAYRLDVSYVGGKLEAYLQYEEISFRKVEASNRNIRTEVLPNIGIAKLPGARYRHMPVDQYRVWCLERIQQAYELLMEVAKKRVGARLEALGAWKPSWGDGPIASDVPTDTEPPLCHFPVSSRSSRRGSAFGWTTWNVPNVRVRPPAERSPQRNSQPEETGR